MNRPQFRTAWVNSGISPPVTRLAIVCLTIVTMISTGCAQNRFGKTHPHHPHHVEPAVPAVVVAGLVSNPGRLVISPDGLTLRDAVSIAGGDIPEERFNTPAPTVFVEIERQGDSKYFALPLVTNDIAGLIRLLPGDRVAVRKIQETNLGRGATIRVTKGDSGLFSVSATPEVESWKRLLDKDPGDITPVAYDVGLSNLGEELETRTVHISTHSSKTSSIREVVRPGEVRILREEIAIYIVPSSDRSNPNYLNVKYQATPEEFERHRPKFTIGPASANTNPLEKAIQGKSFPDQKSLKEEVRRVVNQFNAEHPENPANLSETEIDVLAQNADRVRPSRPELKKPTLLTFSSAPETSSPESTVIVLRRQNGLRNEEYILLRHTSTHACSDTNLMRSTLDSVSVVPGDSVAIEHLLRMPIVLASVAAPKAFDPASPPSKQPHFPGLKKLLEPVKNSLEPVKEQIQGLGATVIPN